MKYLLIFMLLPFLLSVTLIHADDTIKIGAIFSISGEASSISDEHLFITRFAVKEINEQGGVLGKKLELIEFDNKSSALGSREAARKALKQKVVAVIGPSWSSHALVMADVLQTGGIPMITPTATNPKVTQVGEYIFRACFIDSYQGRILAEYSHFDLGAKNLAILTNTGYVYSIDLASSFRKTLEKLGSKVVTELDYSEDLTDYENLVEKLNQFPFDAVFIPGYARDSAQIINKIRSNGVSVPILGGDGWSHLMYNYALDNSLENCFYLTHWHKDLKGSKNKIFLKKIIQFYDLEKVNAGMALSYDSLYLLADAITRSGIADPDHIKDALAETKNFEGVTGKIIFNQERNPIKPAVILRFTEKDSALLKLYHPKAGN